MKKIAIIPIIILSLVGCERQKQQPKPYIAQVGDSKLTVEEVEKYLPEGIETDYNTKKDFVQKWIDSEILYREAMENKLDNDPTIEEEITRNKKQLIINKLIQNELSSISVDTNEIGKYYRENIVEFIRNDDEVKFVYLLVKEDEATETKKKLTGRRLWEIISEKKAEHFTTLDENQTDFIPVGSLIPELAEPMTKLKIGQISNPIKTKDGYYFIELIDRKNQGTYKSLDEVNDSIKEKILKIKQEAKLKILLSELRNKYKVEVNLDKLQPVDQDTLDK
jgi:peptidyl-prolyl cis-trans isomerase C